MSRALGASVSSEGTVSAGTVPRARRPRARHLIAAPLLAALVAAGLTVVGSPGARAATTGTPRVATLSSTAGPVRGGRTVALRGRALAGITSVTLGGRAATILSRSATVVRVRTPAHAAGHVGVVVRTGTTRVAQAAAVRYTYLRHPTLSAVTPATALTAQARTVTLTGTNLVRVSAVLFGTTRALSVSRKSSTRLVVRVPHHVGGTVPVSVVTAGGHTLRTLPFRFAAPTAASAASAASCLPAGTTLVAGQRRRCTTGGTTLIVRADGNVLLYRGSTALWASGTDGHPAVRVTVPAAGGLAISDGAKTLWSRAAASAPVTTPVTTPSPVTTPAPVTGSAIRGDDYPWKTANPQTYSPLRYNYRQCTDFVAWRLNVQAGHTKAPWALDWGTLTPKGGNAVQWRSYPALHPDSKPALGAVAWWGTRVSALGHVAIVSEIDADGSIVVEEYNYTTRYTYDRRHIARTSKDWPDAFLHVRDL